MFHLQWLVSGISSTIFQIVRIATLFVTVIYDLLHPKPPTKTYKLLAFFLHSYTKLKYMSRHFPLHSSYFHIITVCDIIPECPKMSCSIPLPVLWQNNTVHPTVYQTPLSIIPYYVLWDGMVYSFVCPTVHQTLSMLIPLSIPSSCDRMVV